jgi:hypothetical protein
MRAVRFDAATAPLQHRADLRRLGRELRDMYAEIQRDTVTVV